MMKKTAQSLNKQPDSTLLAQRIMLVEEYGIFTLDPEGIVLYWNNGAEKVQGYSEEEVIDQPFDELYEKEVTKPAGYFKQLLAKAKEQGQLEEEGWRQHKNGAYYWSTIFITPIYDEQKRLVAYTVISRDLTERKLASEMSEITEASQEHHQLVLAISNILWKRSLDGQFTAPHLQWEHFTGQVWPDYQGFGWLKMHPEEEREKIKSYWENLSALNLDKMQGHWEIVQQPAINKNLLLKTKLWSKIHREYRHTITTVIPRFQDHKIVEWLGNEKDIHKQAVTKLHLKEMLAEHRVIVNSARLGLWRWDLQTQTIKLDENVAAYLNIDLNHFKQSLDEIIACIHPEDKTYIQTLLQQCFQTGERFNAEFRVVWPDGSLHYLAGIGEVQKDEQEQPVQIVGSYWDITERKQLENERLQALQVAEEKERQRAQTAEMYKRKLEEFMDTLCHEIRNPLNGIYSVVTFLNDILIQLNTLLKEKGEQLGPETAQEIQDAIKEIKNQTETVHHCAQQQKVIVDDVLDLSKLENDKIELNPKIFSVKTVIRYVVQMFASKINEKNLNVVLDIPDEDIFLCADTQRLVQIITNLLSNAIKFTLEGSIYLSATTDVSSEPETLLQICVKDTGIGMTEEETARLFQRFSQASQQTASEYGGSGLGLVISKKFIERMGGTIQVKSKKWHGTEFYFTIRCQTSSKQAYEISQQAQPSQNLTAAVEPVQPKTVLIVEDNPMNQKILQRYLNEAGHVCQTASNGLEALTKFEKFKFDLIFMDIEMPVMNGLEATRKIRKKEESTQTRVVIIGSSGNANDKQRKIALEAGMDDYLVKPYDRKDVYQIMVNCLNHKPTVLKLSSEINQPTIQSDVTSISSDSTTIMPMTPVAMTLINSTASSSSIESYSGTGNLFTLKKRKQESCVTNADTSTENYLNLLVTKLNELLEQYQMQSTADTNYIAVIKKDIAELHLTIEPAAMLESHIKLLQTKITIPRDNKKRLLL